MAEKTPDQIRRETVPVRHTGLIYGFLGGVVSSVVWFGSWGVLHQEQIIRYPEYCTHALRAYMGAHPLFGEKPSPGMSAEQLRYALLRYGNLDHHYDAEIIRHGWYPKEASPRPWVHDNGAIPPVYSESPAMVFKWPFSLTSGTFFASLIWGMVADSRYRSSIIAGLQFDGSVVTTVEAYNREVKGDDMRYAVKPWKDH
jgi:hypothetical protein